MKHIEIDEELYQYIASQTQFIGESASSILRRLLLIEQESAAEPPKPSQENLRRRNQWQQVMYLIRSIKPIWRCKGGSRPLFINFSCAISRAQ